MLRMPLRLALASAVLAFACPLSAELTPAQKATAEAVMRDFTAVEFQARQQAVEKLIALGPDVVPLVRGLYTATKDNEVKLRCEMTLKGIATRWGVVVDLKDPDAPVVVNLGPSKVTLSARDVPLSELLDTLATKSGNKELVAVQAAKDRPVSLDVKDVLYWDAVDQLCRTYGLVLTLDPATQKPALAAMDGTLDPGAVAGPVVLKLNTGSVSRSFRVAKSAWSKPSTIATVAYGAGVYWEDRLNISTVAVVVRKLLLPDGKDVLEGATQPVAQTVTPGVRTRNYSSAYLSFGNVPEGTRRFSAVEGLVRVTCRVGEKAVKLDDVFAGPPRSASAGGVTLTLKSVSERRKGVAQCVVEMKREAGDPAISFAPESGHVTFALIDPKGVRHQATLEGGKFGAPKKTGRKNRLGQDETAEEAEFNLRFWSVPEIEGPWSLTLVWPDKVDTREYPFAIKDAPVP